MTGDADRRYRIPSTPRDVPLRPSHQLDPVEAWRDWWRTLGADPDPVVSAAARRGFVLAPPDLDVVGVTRQRARTLVRRGTWTQAGWGHVAPLFAPGPRHRHALTSAATARRRPRDIVSGRSAAILHGLPTVTVPPAPETTIRPRPVALGRTARGHRFGAALTNREVTSWYGVPITTVGRTLVDLGRHDRFDAVMAVDAALRARLVTPAMLDADLAVAAGWPGVRRAREVLRLGSALAESPLESVTRLRLHDDGFPAPSLQIVLAGYRVDFFWPQFGLVLEADGRVKYVGDAIRTQEPDALWAEKRRETALRRLGLRVERVTWADVVHDWPATAEWLGPMLRLPRATG